MLFSFQVSDESKAAAMCRLREVAGQRRNLETLLVEILPNCTLPNARIEEILKEWFFNESMFRNDPQELARVATECVSDIRVLRLANERSLWNMN